MFSSNTSQVSNAANYIEDVFSTYLYTGNGSTQTITNGIDLSTKGGLVWLKDRTTGTAGYDHALIDTVRGSSLYLKSNSTSAESSNSNVVTGFNSNGFGIGSNTSTNKSSDAFVSWTFREQPKFFDVVTYTGDGTSGRAISHNLGSTPGCIIVKITSAVGPWPVFHRSLGGGGTTENLSLNTTAAVAGNAYFPAVSSTTFSVSASSAVNSSGATYVAYLFAHDAGGFGLTGTDNVISCDSFTTNGSGQATVSLGYEPQWLLVKRSNSTGNWFLVDNMRGFTVTNSTQALYANLSDAEVAINTTYFQPNSTGFFVDTGGASQSYIYIAIRRGPMKVPTSASDYFAPVTRVGNGGNPTISGGITDDAAMIFRRPGSTSTVMVSRLMGNPYLETANANGQNTDTLAFPTNTWDVQQGLKLGGNRPIVNSSGINYIDYHLRRAPSFMDVVCYDGKTGSSQIINHNLGVSPELVIIKRRQTSTYFGWPVYASVVGTNNLYLNDASSAGTYLNGAVSSPTATTFTVSNNSDVNGAGSTFVAYLFATCAGVSKVGSYTGTGGTQTIACGFAGGARFVLVKRTDTTGDWYVWDTARGMVSGTDPSLLLNSTAAEVNANSIYTATGGFQIVSTAAGINASGGTYIFLAIA
jgi:hypothetical protein